MSKSIDWGRVVVVAALDDYREHRTLTSLAQLQERLHQVTGVRVTLSALSMHARGLRSSSKCGPRFKSEGSSEKAKVAMKSINTVDWGQADVIAALDDYREHRTLTSLAQLQENLQQLTGVHVTRSALSLHARGLRGLKRGRRFKSEGSTAKDGGVPQPRLTSSQTPGTLSALAPASPTRSPPRLRRRHILSKGLKKTTLVVAVGHNLHRLYRRVNSKKGTVYYRCTGCEYRRRKSKDGTVANIRVSAGRVVAGRPHHIDCKPLTSAAVAVLKTDRHCRKRVKQGYANPRQSWNLGHDSLANEALHSGSDLHLRDGCLAAAFPPWQDVKRAYNRWARSATPAVKDPYNLPDEFKLTKRGIRDSERWLLLSDPQNQVIVFSTDEQLQVAAASSIIVADATFKTAPRGFHQLYTMHGEHTNSEGKTEWVIVAFALMETKAQSAYEAIFKAIHRRIDELGYVEKFHAIQTDYETAEMQAVAAVFGSQKVRGCLFHFTTAVLKQVKAKGLWLFYQRKGEVTCIWRWIRCLLALPLLPPETAWNVWQLHLQHPPQPPPGWVPPANFTWPTAELKAFADYFGRQWMEMPRSWWNHWNSGSQRTTNAAEAFHSLLARSSESKVHPSMTWFLPWLQVLLDRSQTRLYQLRAGAKARAKSKLYVRLDERLAVYKSRFAKEFAMAGDTASQWAVIMMHLCRTSYLLADVDSKGQTRKQQKKRLLAYKSLTKARRRVAAKVCQTSKIRDVSVSPSISTPMGQHSVTQLPAQTSSVKATPALAKLSVSVQPLPSGSTSDQKDVTMGNGYALTDEDRDVLSRYSDGDLSLSVSSGELISGDVDVQYTVTVGQVLEIHPDTKSWLDDEILTAYFALIRVRSVEPGFRSVYAFQSHFLPALIDNSASARSGRWTSRSNIFTYELLFVPVFKSAHWTLMVVDLRRRQLTYYDSKGGRNTQAVTKLLEYLHEEASRRNEQHGDLQVTYAAEPRQDNGYDCGFFMLQYAECVARNCEPSFTQADIYSLRIKMMVELLQAKLRV